MSVLKLGSFGTLFGQVIEVSCSYSQDTEEFVTDKFRFIAGFVYVIEVKGVPLEEIQKVQVHEFGHTENIMPFHENHELNFFRSNIYEPKTHNLDCTISISAPLQTDPIVYIRQIPINDKIKVNYVKHELKSTYSDSCNCIIPVFIPRSDWGSAYGLTHEIYRDEANYSTVTHLIIHHSATSNTSTNWAGMVSSIFNFHTAVNGWDDIGYNWLIDPDGVLYEGRGGGDDVIGAHMCGYNTNTMGICILGDYTTTEPSVAALSKLNQLLAWKSCNSSLDPLATMLIRSYPGSMQVISGHKDGCAPNYTECPGTYLYSKLNDVRMKTDELLKNCSVSNIHEIASNPVQIFPNPVDDILHFSIMESMSNVQCSIFDQYGNLYKNVLQNLANKNQLDVSHMSTGMYVLLLNGKATRFIKK